MSVWLLLLVGVLSIIILVRHYKSIEANWKRNRITDIDLTYLNEEEIEKKIEEMKLNSLTEEETRKHIREEKISFWITLACLSGGILILFGILYLYRFPE